jgi:hypothetical protein
MQFKIETVPPEPKFDPVTVTITCESLAELQELEIRMHLYMSDLQKVRPDSCSKLPKGNSHLRGIMEFRDKLHALLGKDALIY